MYKKTASTFTADAVEKSRQPKFQKNLKDGIGLRAVSGFPSSGPAFLGASGPGSEELVVFRRWA